MVAETGEQLLKTLSISQHFHWVDMKTQEVWCYREAQQYSSRVGDHMQPQNTGFENCKRNQEPGIRECGCMVGRAAGLQKGRWRELQGVDSKTWQQYSVRQATCALHFKEGLEGGQLFPA